MNKSYSKHSTKQAVSAVNADGFLTESLKESKSLNKDHTRLVIDNDSTKKTLESNDILTVGFSKNIYINDNYDKYVVKHSLESLYDIA